MSHPIYQYRVESTSIKLLLLMSLCCWSGQVLAGEPSFSEPLDEPVIIHERLVSDESVEVPAEPVPPSGYQGLDAFTPALIAEEILRLRDSLGEAPLSGRTAFQPLPLANETQDSSHSPAELAFDEEGHFEMDEMVPTPMQREADRRLIRQRLRGMASRPMFERPYFSPLPHHAEVVIDHPLNLPPVPCEPAVSHGYPVPTYVPVTQYIDPHTLPHPEPPHYLPPAGHVVETQINVLRETARQLEESAHHLECQEQFDRADQIRELAQKLRQDAREQREQGSASELRTVRPVQASQAACQTPICPPEIPETAVIPQYEASEGEKH